MADLSGRTLGPYEFHEEIGRGGMANVYRATQTTTGREVAIKVLPAHFLQDQTFLDRFMHEGEIVAGLQHPRILPVYDYGQADGLPYIAMAYMPGGTLSDRIAQFPQGMPIEDAARLVEQIAEGLDFAHRRGVIHRDFKPDNLLFDGDDNPYLSDFGLARIAETSASQTGDKVVASPGYMAPELGKPGEPSPQVDVYALGVTLFEMLTGSQPFEADTPLRLMYLHVNEPVPDIHDRRDDLPDGVAYVIKRAMAKDPVDRYVSPRDLASDLYAVAAGEWDGEKVMSQGQYGKATLEHQLPSAAEIEASSVRPPSTSAQRPASQKKRRQLPLVALFGGLFGALALLALVAVVVIFVLPDRGEVPAAGQTADVTTTASEAAPSPTPVSLGSTVERLGGAVDVQVSGSASFQPLLAPWAIMPGDVVRTGPDGSALVYLTRGVFAELYGDSEIVMHKIEQLDEGWLVEVTQNDGLVYHSVLPGAGLEYVLHTPAATVHVVGTIYWAQSQSDGWCFLPEEGSILIDIGDDDEDVSDDHLLHATGESALLVADDGTASPGACQIDPALSDGPTPTASSAGGFAPAQPDDPCVNQGGLQWQGTTCACSGVISHVTICNDGTKWDSPTSDTCEPGSGCQPAAGGGGGGSNDDGGGGGPVCGNGIVEPGEACDPPGYASGGCAPILFCSATCAHCY